MSLYAEYLKEREGISVIEKENGYATYTIGREECYLIDLYVRPDFRHTGFAAELAQDVINEALLRGCKYLTGSVDITTKHASENLQRLLKWGMRLAKTQGNMIYVIKEIV